MGAAPAPGASLSMGGAPRVTVVIPTKNAGPRFREVLAAARGQQTRWPFEVLVIDSGSTDGTLEFLRHEAATPGPELRVLEIPPEAFGHGRTRNQAIAASAAPFAALLTHDAQPADPGWLARLVAPLEADPRVAGVFGRHRAYPEHGPLVARDLEAHFDFLARMPSPMALEDLEPDRADPDRCPEVRFYSDNNSALRREVWARIPYPDVAFAEDQLWAAKVLRAGYRKAYADDAVVLHSHRFAPSELFRRQFDEARALFQAFGEHLCPSLPGALWRALRQTLVDWRYLARVGEPGWRWWLEAGPSALARFAGQYLGTRLADSPWGDRLSWDHALKEGRR